MVGEAEAAKSATCVTFSYYGSGPIFEASAKSTEFPGTYYVQYVLAAFLENNKQNRG